VARIWEKPSDPSACLFISQPDSSRDVLAMTLVEPGLAEHGAGEVAPGSDHVSMIFVDPDMWGRNRVSIPVRRPLRGSPAMKATPAEITKRVGS